MTSTQAMTPRAERSKSAAIVCFIPDFGHLQPLLKIADALAEAGFHIKCYIADECSPLMKRFDFEFANLENTSQHKQLRRMENIFKRGLFFSSVCLYAHFLLMYPRVARSVELSTGALCRQLHEQAPDIIICDGLWFTDLYKRMAAALGVPLVVNSLDGSLAYCQREFVKTYGVTTIPRAIQAGVEIAASVSRQLCASLYRACYFGKWLEARACRRAAKTAFETAFPIAPAKRTSTEWIVVGTAALERERLGNLIRRSGAIRREFPPIEFRSKICLPQPLRDWIEADDGRPVVYVSFGTAVDLDEGFTREVHSAFCSLPVRVLWSLPAAQQSFVSHLAKADNIRLETFVPQAEVLKMSCVRCFVTQAGPHSVQEAIFGATPMLCIPFFVDQAYNSSVVEHLGIGMRLWRSKLSSRSVAAALTAILADPAYSDRVERLRIDVARREGSEALAHYLSQLANPPRPVNA